MQTQPEKGDFLMKGSEYFLLGLVLLFGYFLIASQREATLLDDQNLAYFKYCQALPGFDEEQFWRVYDSVKDARSDMAHPRD